jgi:hypothetical protein
MPFTSTMSFISSGKNKISNKGLNSILFGPGGNRGNNRNGRNTNMATSNNVYTIPNYGSGNFAANGLGVPYIFSALDTNSISHTITQIIPSNSSSYPNSYYFSDANNSLFYFTFNSPLIISVVITGGGVPYTLVPNTAYTTSGQPYTLFTFYSTAGGLQLTPPYIASNGNSATILPANS